MQPDSTTYIQLLVDLSAFSLRMIHARLRARL